MLNAVRGAAKPTAGAASDISKAGIEAGIKAAILDYEEHLEGKIRDLKAATVTDKKTISALEEQLVAAKAREGTLEVAHEKARKDAARENKLIREVAARQTELASEVIAHVVFVRVSSSSSKSAHLSPTPSTSSFAFL